MRSDLTIAAFCSSHGQDVQTTLFRRLVWSAAAPFGVRGRVRSFSTGWLRFGRCQSPGWRGWEQSLDDGPWSQSAKAAMQLRLSLRTQVGFTTRTRTVKPVCGSIILHQDAPIPPVSLRCRSRLGIHGSALLFEETQLKTSLAPFLAFKHCKYSWYGIAFSCRFLLTKVAAGQTKS